jgi:hypothetical protein
MSHPEKKPPIVIGTYQSHGVKTMVPDAAVFNKGIRGQDRAEMACEVRRLHNSKLSDPSRKGWPKQSPLS